MTDLSEQNLLSEIRNEYESSAINTLSTKASENLSSKPEVESYGSKICSYFSRNGFCRFGDSCKYSHRRQFENKKHLSQSSVKKFAAPGVTDKEKYTFNEDFHNRLKSSQVVSKQVCRYYAAGQCDKKDDCRFKHSQELVEDHDLVNDASNSQKIVRKIYGTNNRTYKKKSMPLCYFFKKGQCYKGDQCKYYHQNKYFSNSESSSSLTEKNNVSSFISNTEINIVPSEENSKTDKSSAVFKKSLNTLDLSSSCMENVPLLRTTEISQLKKRFPHYEVIKENTKFSVMFQPSDPDWPFDVKNLKIEVEFPEDYPREKCAITVIHDVEIIPQLLIKHLNKAIQDWITKKYEDNSTSDKLELVFRPFLKWFDKNLEELFITGLRKVKQDLKAKEDGIEFVPVEKLFPSSDNNLNCNNSVPNEDSNQMTEYLLQSPAISSDSKQPLPLNNQNKPFHYAGNDGVKLLLSELELTEGAAALVCTKISVTLQCCRCRTSFNMKSVPKKSNSYVCSKCSKNVGFTFEPNTVHQFSNVLGNLHLLDCVAVDVNLVECHFLIDCLSCSKQVPTDGIHYGQKHKMWCNHCNGKMVMNIGSAKFQALKLPSVSGLKYLPAKKSDKKIKDPVIKEGEPLPNYGACKHYKKSYRWLRFPCCGRLYPCDECHNEKETDHEMKYASRMICGFCAKEQPYSKEKPCFVCSQNLTKKSGSHWEGGKGCRNKIQMSREDKQKYSGVSKTVSKKAQNTKTKKKN